MTETIRFVVEIVVNNPTGFPLRDDERQRVVQAATFAGASEADQVLRERQARANGRQ